MVTRGRKNELAEQLRYQIDKGIARESLQANFADEMCRDRDERDYVMSLEVLTEIYEVEE